MKWQNLVQLFLGVLAISAPGIVNAQTGAADQSRRVVLSERDTYMDLRSGTMFRIGWDAVSNTYARKDGLPLDLYTSTVSADTFWGAQAFPVKNMLIPDGAGYYTVDQTKLDSKLKENGDGLKWKPAGGEDKTKINENELKVKDGNTKVKDNENEFKMKHGEDKTKINGNERKGKTGDGKTKENGNELKAKDDQGKIKDNGKELKYKEDNGTKVKSNYKETKVKTDSTKTIFNHKTGEVKIKSR